MSTTTPTVNVVDTSAVDDPAWWASKLRLRDEPWAIPLIAMSATNIIAILAFEVYIIVKAFQSTPSRRHLFLGQCLLFGLIAISVVGLPFALYPTTFVCSSSRLLLGSAPAMVFGTLLVKCVFLISLNSGVYLPAHYQGILLFFVVLVQGVMSVQWLTTFPSEVKMTGIVTVSEVLVECQSSYKEYIMSLVYVMALIIAVAVFAIKCRGIRENYRESSHIGVSLCIVCPLWLAWTLTGFALPQRLQPACLGFGCVITGTVVFLVMFIPKGRQLAAFGRDGFYRGDRELDRLSSISSARYSPSFFLFQPAKSKDVVRPNFLSNNKNEGTIYKTNLSSETFGYGFGSSNQTPFPNFRQPFHFAPLRYSAPYFPLHHYYQHYYPGVRP